MSFRSLFRMGKSTVANIVSEISEYIWDSLYEIHMPVPSNGDFQQITKDFYEIWNFPNCIGALDGKHIRMHCPNNSGSLYFNYKGYFSIVLQALVDANYKFINIDVGGYGKQSDGGTFKASALYRKIINGTLNLPEDSLLPNSNLSMPHVIIADEAYPLMRNLLKPYTYPGSQLSTSEKIFNYRLSRARRIVENAFGILVSRFRVFENAIPTSLNTVDAIVCASCALHNWLRKNSDSYITPTCVDREDSEGQIIPGTWRSEITPLISINDQRRGNHSVNAKEKRDLLKSYFMTNGSVPWQFNRIS
nr:unnamed protein product [Callosobruchus chinensis]